MATLATPTVVDQLYIDAERKAAANPPGRVLATVILAMFTALGWIAGRLWVGVWFCAMSVQYGFRKGANITLEPRPAPS